MQCPKCNEELEQGGVHIRSNFLWFLFYGFSYMSLYFRKGEPYQNSNIVGGSNKDDQLLLGPHNWLASHRCHKCRLAIIDYGDGK